MEDFSIYIYIYIYIDTNEKSMQEKVLDATTSEEVYNPEKCQIMSRKSVSLAFI